MMSSSVRCSVDRSERNVFHTVVPSKCVNFRNLRVRASVPTLPPLRSALARAQCRDIATPLHVAPDIPGLVPAGLAALPPNGFATGPGRNVVPDRALGRAGGRPTLNPLLHGCWRDV